MARGCLWENAAVHQKSPMFQPCGSELCRHSHNDTSRVRNLVSKFLPPKPKSCRSQNYCTDFRFDLGTNQKHQYTPRAVEAGETEPGVPQRAPGNKFELFACWKGLRLPHRAWIRGSSCDLTRWAHRRDGVDKCIRLLSSQQLAVRVFLKSASCFCACSGL